MDEIKHREGILQKKAFEYYFSLGEKRTIEKVAKKFGVGRSTIGNWSRWFDWNMRVKLRDIEVSKKLQEETDTAIVDVKAAYRKEIEVSMNVVRAVIKIVVNDINKYFKELNFYNAGQTNTPPKMPKVLRVNSSKELARVIMMLEKLMKLDLLMLGEPTDIIKDGYTFNSYLRFVRQTMEIENE